jgi:hypothetical protein
MTHRRRVEPNKEFYPVSEDEISMNRGDWSHYGRHRSKEIPRYLEYLESIRNKKPTPPKHESTMQINQTSNTEDVYKKIRKIREAEEEKIKMINTRKFNKRKKPRNWKRFKNR